MQPKPREYCSECKTQDTSCIYIRLPQQHTLPEAHISGKH